MQEGHPMIAGLDDLISLNESPSKIRVEFDRLNDDTAFSDPKNIGYFFLDAMFDTLGIYDVLTKYKSNSKVEYDLNGHVKNLVFGRVLDPDSKYATWEARDSYLFDVVSSRNLAEVYRTLDVLDEQSDNIQRRMNYKIDNM